MSTLRKARPAGPSLQAPRTLSAVVRQARDALRRYRQADAATRTAADQGQLTDQPSQLAAQRLTLQLPIPVAADAQPGVSPLDQSYCLYDEGDWPGGIVQKFRALRPLMEATLEGYDPQFLGMLENPADGLGCWTLTDMTLCGITTNATFSSFAKLCQGGYGNRPLQSGHTVIAVNPEWTGPRDIGQFWERKLKAAAEELLAPDSWQVLYSCSVVRTSRGKGFGVMVGSYDLGWHVWSAESEESTSVNGDRCLLWSEQKPEQQQVVEVLNAAAVAAKSGG